MGFREKTFDSDVARGSVGYGRHYEARSQLEAHRYEGRIVASVRPDAPGEVRDALVANLDRLDAPVDRFEPLSIDGPR